ncbi:MAG: ECF-type sigma factor [Candidatus Omnitrophota bacterium]|jgi:predicted transcriptional regulator
MRSRLKAQKERDRRNVASLYLKGVIQADIADQLGISQSTVSKDLKLIQSEWAVARINDIDERKRIELAKIDNLELTYWDGWKRSQENAEVETTKLKGRDADKPTDLEKTKRVEGQVGDPRFLQGVANCIDKRCELLGLNAPKNVDVTSGGEKIEAVKIIEVIKSNDETV